MVFYRHELRIFICLGYLILPIKLFGKLSVYTNDNTFLLSLEKKNMIQI